MKLNRIKVAFVILLILFAAFNASAQISVIDDLQKGVVNFSETLAKSLPFNSSLGLAWSDAYIGKFLPSMPPHFGVGAVFGVTTLSVPGLQNVTKLLGYAFPDSRIKLMNDRIILPAWALEARLGGIFLPFDVGVKFGMMPDKNWGKLPYDIKYKMAGADLRWSILDGKTKKLLPNLSFGIGFNYLSGGLGVTVGKDTNFMVDTKMLTIESPKIGLLWETKGVEAKIHLSKSILIITPYLGMAAGYSWSQAGYEVKSDILIDGSPISAADKAFIKNYLSGNKLESMNFIDNGISTMVKNKAWNFRAFGGMSFNIMILKLDLGVMYNILDKQFGASLGARIQL